MSREPDVIDPRLQAAHEALTARRFSETIDLCDEILAEKPGFLPAKAMAGVARLRSGQASAAVGILREVMEAAPESPDPPVWLGAALRGDRLPEAAVEVLSKAVERFPGYPDLQNELGETLLALRRTEAASTAFQQAVQLAPGNAVYLRNLGAAQAKSDHKLEAERTLRQALRVSPHDPLTLETLGDLLEDMTSQREAAALFHRAYALSPQGIRGQLNLAKALSAEGKTAEALAAALRATESAPAEPEGWLLAGTLQLELGMFSQAEDSLSRALELDPESVDAIFLLVQCRRFGATEDELLTRARKWLERESWTSKEWARLHYAMAKILQDRGDLARAMEHFDQANQAMQGQLEAPFDLAGHEHNVTAAIRKHGPEKIAGYEGPRSASHLPVILVGMIRSGTTLLEQLLARHTQISAGGEMDFWNELQRDQKRGCPAPSLEQLLGGYLAEFEKRAQGCLRVIDKNPVNFTNLGLIHMLLPNARIIHCRRHPWDTCLSIYTTLFRNPIPWAHDKENIAFCYVEYRRLMEHWARAVPRDRLLEIDYESLVSDPEHVLRRVIEFLGLDWEESCLDPSADQGGVRTPSMWQVRQPIYQSSVGRWRRYRPWLGEFEDLLTPEERNS